MRRPAAALGSVTFLGIAPGTVAGLIPWWLTGWELREPPAPLDAITLPVRIVAAALILAGAVFVLVAFARFVLEGLGTPAPVAPPERLVVGGVYRYVRNPMYVAVLSMVLGQALLFWEPALWLWFGLAGAAMVTFVRVYEEPDLSERFGADYERYRAAVPGWWPRLRAWTPEN